MKLVLKKDGLTGESLKFVEDLNLKFSELPDQLTADDVRNAVKGMVKGLWKENGECNVDFEKLSGMHEKVFGDGEDSLQVILKKQGMIINELKELGKPGESNVKSIRDQLAEFHTKNADRLQAFLSGESKQFGTEMDPLTKDMRAGIVVKAPVTMTISASSGGSAFAPAPEIMPGLVDIRRNRPFIEQYANSANTNRARIVWTEKTNKQGNATWLAEGGVKPLISFEWVSRESYAKKVAAKIKVSTEALQDVDWLAAEIETELKYEVDIAVDNALFAGTGDGTSGALTLKGITEYAPGYLLNNVLTTDPNEYDVIRAMIAQITTMNGTPTHVFFNTISGANMDLLKDDNGRPIAKEYRDGDGKIWRLTPVEVNNIPEGSVLVADMSRFKVRNYQAFAIYYGWVNDDFEKNLVTVIGERRLHAFMAENDLGTLVYDTFANVKTLITAP